MILVDYIAGLGGNIFKSGGHDHLNQREMANITNSVSHLLQWALFVIHPLKKKNISFLKKMCVQTFAKRSILVRGKWKQLQVSNQDFRNQVVTIRWQLGNHMSRVSSVHILLDICHMTPTWHCRYYYAYVFDMKWADFTGSHLFIHAEFPLKWRTLLFTIEVYHHSVCHNEVNGSSVHTGMKQPAKSSPKY